MGMNKRQKEIEDIRKDLINDFIGDDTFLYTQLSSITQRLWMISHKLTRWQSFMVRIKRLFLK